MSWLVISILGYFFIAWEVILDKFMLSSKKVSHPSVYAFYSGVLSLSTLLIFFPFGFHLISLSQVFFSLISGMIFVFGILFIFYALDKNEASRVTPVVGAVIPIASYFIALFFLGEVLHQKEIIGIGLLIFGGFIISFDFHKKGRNKLYDGLHFSILAGVFLAIAYSIFKKLYAGDSFVNVYIWTRLGLFLGALSFLLLPSFREKIFGSFGSYKKKKKENSRTGALFVFNKILGGGGSMLFNYAVSLGSVTIVNALVATEYVFVFAIGLIFSVWLPKVFQENRNSGVIFQKVLSMVIIGIGVALVSRV